MLPSRAEMFGSFVSLSEALEAIARKVRLADAQITAHLPPNARIGVDDFEHLALRAALRDQLARGQAASLLLRCLNQPAGQRPNWQELQDGVAFHDEAAFRHGLRWLALEERGAGARPIVHDLDLDRCANRLGFHVDELIDILDSQGIAHTLRGTRESNRLQLTNRLPDGSLLQSGPAGNTGLAPESIGIPVNDRVEALDGNDAPGAVHEAAVVTKSGHTGDATATVTLEGVERASESRTSSRAEARMPPISRPVTTHDMDGKVKRRFRGPLAEVLNLAIGKARDPHDHRSVFAALCDLARAPEPPIPLLGYNAADNVVLWNNGDLERPDLFDLEDMYSRLRPRKKATRKRTTSRS